MRSAGLEFRVTAGGAKSWSFRFRDPTRAGNPLARATIGSYPAMELYEAREQSVTMRKAVEAGRNPIAERKAARSGVGSFGRLAARYLAEYAERRKRSHKRDARNLELHVLPHWKAKAATAIERGDVIELVERLVTAGKPVAANRVQALVSKVFSFGIDAGALKFNPCHRMAKRGTETAGRRVLSDPEIRLLWSGVITPKAPRSGLALRLTLLTGARIGEVAGLCRSELHQVSDQAKAAWIIPGSRTKNKRDHLIPLSGLARDTVIELLEMIGPNDEYLLPARSQRGGPMSANSLWQAMAYFGDRIAGDDDAIRTWKADLPSPHDLRRTVETRMAELRIPKEYRDRVLNHVPGDVGSRHYNLHDYEPEKRDALNRWALALGAILEGMAGGTVVSITEARKKGQRS
jgi:integrase